MFHVNEQLGPRTFERSANGLIIESNGGNGRIAEGKGQEWEAGKLRCTDGTDTKLQHNHNQTLTL